MKSFITTLMIIVLAVPTINAQSVMMLNDPHIQAQQKRNVFMQWGDFKPNPRNFLGINMNPHYTLTWSYLAPTQNRRYRSGADIRPLGPSGKQTQRMALNIELKNTTEQYRKHADTIGYRADSELYNTSGLFSSLDPLWRLYYSKELKGVTAYNLQDILNEIPYEQREYLVSSQAANWYDQEMKILQEKLNAAFNQDIERGARIIHYHNLMLEYRNLQRKWAHHRTIANQVKDIYKRKMAASTPVPTSSYSWNTQNDVQLMKSIVYSSWEDFLGHKEIQYD
ncbi:MAG TPA: hypothetical protein VKZ57_02805 [Sphingobacterium sp.]|nr:hypothetical protein [Sphingobacterium sp.]